MRSFSTLLARAIGAVFLSLAAVAHPQTFPTKPIRVIVGFGPGGVADLTARIVGEKLGHQLGQQVLVENRPSAGGIVAAEAVARAEPDGYTLLLMSNGNAVSASLFKSLPYDAATAFAPISTLGFFDIAVVVAADSKIGSVQELLAFAKANPGKLNIGTINIGSTQNLSAELFKSMAGIDATTVPFKSSGDVIAALRSGNVQVAFEILAPVVPQMKGGTVKILALASDRRFAGLPDVPTVAESGVPGYQASSWNALAAPAKTPRAVVDRLNKEINAAVSDPQVREKLQGLHVAARASTPEELAQLLASDTAKWRRVIDQARIERQ
jgi:tripartite-type tricarboxylate transporter receptor subunit TctC